MNVNQIIASLVPGASARISGDSSCWVNVERSGDGKTLRYVRFTPSGFVVFRTCAF